MLNHLPELFETTTPKTNNDPEKEEGDLQGKAGELTMEVDFLEKKCKPRT